MRKTIFFLIFLVTNLFAYLGQISGIQGEVFLKRDDIIFKAYENTQLQSNDKIITKNSQAQIILNNGAVITLFNNSDLQINKTLFLDYGNMKILTHQPITINTIRNQIIANSNSLCIIKSTHTNTKIQALIGKLKFKLLAENKFYYIDTGKELIFKPDILNPIKIVKLERNIFSFVNYSNIANNINDEANEDNTNKEIEEAIEESNEITEETNEDTTIQEVDNSINDVIEEDTTTQTEENTNNEEEITVENSIENSVQETEEISNDENVEEETENDTIENTNSEEENSNNSSSNNSSNNSNSI